MLNTNNKDLKVQKRIIPFYAMRIEEDGMVNYYVGNEDFGNLLHCFSVQKKCDDPAFIANLEQYCGMYYEEFIKEVC